MTSQRPPAYLALQESGELQRRAQAAVRRLAYCDICPRRCGVDRLADIRGVCRTGRRARLYSFGPHMGEERPLVGRGGSGTIFFSNCNLSCQYCQNYELSQLGQGRDVDAEELADIMLQVQRMGCHNVNLVSPTHVVPQILEALVIAVEGGLSIPLVYNTGGYDAISTLELLDGVVDIYMPDLKYADAGVGKRLSNVGSYPERSQAAAIEMHRQVGDLQVDRRGIATRGLLIRHLVLPNDLAGSALVAAFIAEKLSPNTYVNVMAQYQPAYRARQCEGLERPLAPAEYQAALDAFRAAGLNRLDRPEGHRG